MRSQQLQQVGGVLHCTEVRPPLPPSHTGTLAHWHTGTMAQWHTHRYIHTQTHTYTLQASKKKSFEKEQASAAESNALAMEALGTIMLGVWGRVCVCAHVYKHIVCVCVCTLGVRARALELVCACLQAHVCVGVRACSCACFPAHKHDSTPSWPARAGGSSWVSMGELPAGSDLDEIMAGLTAEECAAIGRPREDKIDLLSAPEEEVRGCGRN